MKQSPNYRYILFFNDQDISGIYVIAPSEIFFQNENYLQRSLDWMTSPEAISNSETLLKSTPVKDLNVNSLRPRSGSKTSSDIFGHFNLQMAEQGRFVIYDVLISLKQ